MIIKYTAHEKENDEKMSRGDGYVIVSAYASVLIIFGSDRSSRNDNLGPEAGNHNLQT